MIANRIIEADHGDLVEVGEQGLHHRVFEAELCISLLAVLRRPRGEHLILEKRDQDNSLGPHHSSKLQNVG